MIFETLSSTLVLSYGGGNRETRVPTLQSAKSKTRNMSSSSSVLLPLPHPQRPLSSMPPSLLFNSEKRTEYENLLLSTLRALSHPESLPQLAFLSLVPHPLALHMLDIPRFVSLYLSALSRLSHYRQLTLLQVCVRKSSSYIFMPLSASQSGRSCWPI